APGPSSLDRHQGRQLRHGAGDAGVGQRLDHRSDPLVGERGLLLDLVQLLLKDLAALLHVLAPEVDWGHDAEPFQEPAELLIVTFQGVAARQRPTGAVTRAEKGIGAPLPGEDEATGPHRAGDEDGLAVIRERRPLHRVEPSRWARTLAMDDDLFAVD